MEKGVGDEKYENNERLNDEKEGKCPYVTPPIDMEDGVGDEKDDKIDIIDDEKEA